MQTWFVEALEKQPVPWRLIEGSLDKRIGMAVEAIFSILNWQQDAATL